MFWKRVGMNRSWVIAVEFHGVMGNNQRKDIMLNVLIKKQIALRWFGFRNLNEERPFF